MRFNKKMKAGEKYSFSVVGSTTTSAHHDDVMNERERLTIFAKLEGHDRLIKFHNAAWDELWKSDIQIEGDEQSQQDIHSMLYHLYSFAREGSDYSPSPMGLSGLGYNGHVFWDTELWMFPAVLVLHPEIAEGMINYRFNRLEEARKMHLHMAIKERCFHGKVRQAVKKKRGVGIERAFRTSYHRMRSDCSVELFIA